MVASLISSSATLAAMPLQTDAISRSKFRTPDSRVYSSIIFAKPVSSTVN